MKIRLGALGIGVVMIVINGCGSKDADEVHQYAQPNGHPLALHIFYPEGNKPATGWPTIIFFHGGAWQFGSPEQFFPQCKDWAKAGVFCISAEYRVATRHASSPQDAADDARAATEYVIAHATHYQLDSNKIVLAGGSAGGHLAAIVASGQPDIAAVPVSALLLFNPMVDLSPGEPDHLLVKDNWQAISPMQQMSKGFPPSLLLLGTRDSEIPVATAEAFCDKAKGLGSDCELAIYENQKHGFFNPSVSQKYYDLTMTRSREFLQKHIAILDN